MSTVTHGTVGRRGGGLVGGLAAGLVLASCIGGEAPSSRDCERACSLASRCGLLPSALGGSIGDGTPANEDDCIERCLASDASAVAVAGLLDVLASGDNDVMESLPLCSEKGRNGCEEVAEILDETPETSELEVTTTLEVSMVSAISHASNFSPERWCCFGYLGELEDDAGDEGMYDPTDPNQARTEIDAVYPILESTFECFRGMETALLAADEAFRPDGEGNEPDPQVVEDACSAVAQAWYPDDAMMLGPGDEPDLETDPCHYARMSRTLVLLDVSTTVTSCDEDAFRQLDMDLRRVGVDWRISADGEDDLLVFDQQLKDEPTLQQDIEIEIRDEITRPDGFVTEVCAELDDESASGDGCEGVDVTALDPDACLSGPPCSEADCLLDSPGCDRTLCDADVSPPGRDCGFFGIETVTLGYRTDEGVEILGEPISGCAERTAITTVFPEVKVGTVVPIAVVSGTLPTSFLPAESAGTDGTFEWVVEGDPRWISAGDAEIRIPSPLLEHTAYRYENPLEFLGWVLPRVPQGRACDDQPMLCETLGNDNCDDGLDNDGDGFTDGASPWCDELFYELVELCVVTEPGRAPAMGCNDTP